MRIKKINDDKVQIIITNQDLEERDFKKWELMPITPKAQELFQDLLDMAYHECGFELEDDSQLIVEAYPLSGDSFVIVMTKIRPVTLNEQLSNLLPNYQLDDEKEEMENERELNQVWCFFDLEDCIQVCARIDPIHVDRSALYKYEDQYYLTLTAAMDKDCDVAAVFGEYGEWVPLDEEFFKEHGKALILREAITNLACIKR